jgi:hypothetical protein
MSDHAKQPRKAPAESPVGPDGRTRQERGYDEVARGPEGVDQPPGPQDALTRQEAEDQRKKRETVDDREARRAANDVDKRERSADRHADPSFRRTGG